MGVPLDERVRRHREALRASGLRPVQLWVPDIRREGFEEECRRQSRIVAAVDNSDPDLDSFSVALADDLLEGEHDS